MTTFFDGVLDEHMDVVFNGTPEETLQFLQENMEDSKDFLVCSGEDIKIYTVEQYLERSKRRAQTEDHQA
jgi:hypothetical protein